VTSPVDAVAKGRALPDHTGAPGCAWTTIRYCGGHLERCSVSGYLTLYGGGASRAWPATPIGRCGQALRASARCWRLSISAWPPWRAANRAALACRGLDLPAKISRLDLVEAPRALQRLESWRYFAIAPSTNFRAEWASFPDCQTGASAYGQPAKTASALRLFHADAGKQRRDAGLAA